ncbi:ABC transporter permease [Actinoplanes sp. NPDC051861]|uniref:ABC transporter permease n=1 Tax=Actinoplanes sp. NPDC051861 TaxID=3155170 RepID=UPI00342A7A2B
MTAATVTAPAASRTRKVGLIQGLGQTKTLAWRTIARIKENPGELGELAFQPIIFTLLFTYVFGAAISGDRSAYLQFMIPGMMVMTMLSTTLQVGQGLNTDLSKGVFDRFRSLPIARWAPLAGRILADQTKQIWGIVLVLLVGLILGFRPGNGFLGFLGAAALMLVFAAAFSWVAVLIGVTSPDAERVQMFGMVVVLPISFISGVFAPTETMPGVFRVFADINPVGNLLEASRGLANGGPVAEPLTWTLAWCAALVIIFAPLSIRALNKRV